MWPLAPHVEMMSNTPFIIQRCLVPPLPLCTSNQGSEKESTRVHPGKRSAEALAKCDCISKSFSKDKRRKQGFECGSEVAFYTRGFPSLVPIKQEQSILGVMMLQLKPLTSLHKKIYIELPITPKSHGRITVFIATRFQWCACHREPMGGCHCGPSAVISNACSAQMPRCLRRGVEGVGHCDLMHVLHKATEVIFSRGKPLLLCFLHGSCLLSELNRKRSGPWYERGKQEDHHFTKINSNRIV